VWRSALVIVEPETVIAWHRQGLLCGDLGRVDDEGTTGRPTDVRVLIRTMSQANPLSAARRIHGELLKLGLDVSSLSYFPVKK
jgi:hypothetical protein